MNNDENYEPMFDDPIRIQTKAFYYFELIMRTRKCNRFNLYVKHRFFYNQLLENFAQNEDTTIISLDLEAEEAARLTMKKIAADWN